MAKKIGSRGTRKRRPARTAAAQEIAAIDAGPAPIESIRRAKALSADVRVIDAGPTRVPAPPPKRPPDLPLNPLRAGAAIARGAGRQKAVAQLGGLEEVDGDGGRAPKSPARGKRPQGASKAKPRPAGKKRRRQTRG